MSESAYDVVVLGGAFTGAATAILLSRDRPRTRVLVIEKRDAFDEKVGEATTEMSGMFLTRRLALWRHLELEHLPKEGLRYWFYNDTVTSHSNSSEAGGVVRSPVPSFQLRRDVLDEHLLSIAAEEGVDVVRPGRVESVETRSGSSTVVFSDGNDRREVECRWVIDATGRSSVLGRSRGLIRQNEQHPICAMWARWNDVRHIDDIAASGGGGLAGANVGSRRLGTNHYMGRGRWIWVIPLGNGETSIGVVWDPRLYDLNGMKPREAYHSALAMHPALSELLEGASIRDDDFRTFRNLAYRTDQYMGDGWALVGDAAIFIDPYYSPGLDHAAFSIESTVRIVAASLDGENVDDQIREHNETFLRSHDRFFDSIYREKYEYMGELDLLAASFLIDTAQYYIFVVIPAYKIHRRFHWMPVLGPKPAFFSYHLMRLYNRRFGAIARLRREAGMEGRFNSNRRINAYFNLELAPFRMVLRGLRLWLLAEIDSIGVALARMRGAVESPSETGDEATATD